MKLRKLNRALHRDLGYIFFGMTIIYSVSGIVLNHRSGTGDASVATRVEEVKARPVAKEDVDRDYILTLLDEHEVNKYKSFYFPSDRNLMIYLNNGHVNLDLTTGEGRLTLVRKRPVLTEFNFLHYNKPKKLWTWFSDIYAVSLGLLAITGLFILKGRNGITRRGAVLVSFGIVIPVIFLAIYLW